MVNFLEYLYKPFIETCFWFYNLFLILYYHITDEKVTTENYYRHGYKEYKPTFNTSEIDNKKIYLSKNFPWILKLIWNCFILWCVYTLIINFGIVEIVKLFI